MSKQANFFGSSLFHVGNSNLSLSVSYCYKEARKP
jgi:hypothetical protein